MTDEEPLDVVTNGRRGWLPVVVVLVAAAVALTVVLGTSQLGDVFSRTDQTAETAGEVRANQCAGLRDQVVERTIIIQESPQPTRLTRFWTQHSLPRARERMKRIGCGDIPTAEEVRERFR